MSAPRVSVIVANLDGERVLPDLLDSLERQSVPPAETIVADDGSQDFSREVARARPGVRLVERGAVAGASAARNAGTAAAGGDVLAFIDNDSVAHPDWIREGLAALERQPRWGAAGSMVLVHGNPAVVNGCGADLNRSLFGRDHGFGRPVASCAFAEDACLYAMSNGLFVRRAVADAVGPWDEAIPYYYEDTDFCLRVWLAGFEVGRAPAAVVHHKIAVTPTGAAPRKVEVGERHRIRMVLKYLTLTEAAAWLYQEARSRRPGGGGGGRGLPLRSVPRLWVYNLRHAGSALAFRRRHPPSESAAWRSFLDPAWGGRELSFHNFRPAPPGCAPRGRIDALVHGADWRYGVYPLSHLADGTAVQWLDGDASIDVVVPEAARTIAADVFVPPETSRSTAHVHLAAPDGTVVWRVAQRLSPGRAWLVWPAEVPAGRYRLAVEGEGALIGGRRVLFAYSRFCFSEAATG